MSIWRKLGKKLIEVPDQDPRSTARNRLALPFMIGTGAFLMIGIQLVSLSLEDSRPRQRFADTTTSIERGKIYDRTGRILATTLPAFELYADPRTIMNPYEATVQLSDLLPNLTEEQIFSQLTRNTRYAELSWRVSPATYAKALERGIVGVYGRERATRFYPQKYEAAHLIGTVNKDNKGLTGIESGMNDALAKGEDVHLSIDIAVQAILREEIETQISKFQAIGGAGLVMDVKTGEIIALTSLPQYNANYYSRADKDAQFNRATKGVYEMGSTFKILNTAMALESGVFTADDMVDVVSPLRVAGRTINDYHPEKQPLNVAEVMVVSSNKGSARIADALGADVQQKYLSSLGLLNRLNLEIPEVATPIIPAPWQRVSTMTVSYGHGISVTLAHLAAAVSTTIGDGTRVYPSLIKGGVKKDYEERVFSHETVRQIRAIMRRVVTHKRGTGKFANIEGYVVGGKTGTSEKIVDGRYDKKLNITSFLAAFPAHDPKYVVVAMVDEPKGQKFSHYYATGGWVAAPAVGGFIRRAAPLLNVAPVDEDSPKIRPFLEVNSPQLDAEVQNASY